MKPLLAAAALILAATPALAAPPPLPVAVTFMKRAGAQDSVDRSSALLQTLVADNWFGDAPANSLLPAFTPCFGAQDLEACARNILTQRGKRTPAEVLVLLEPAPEGRTRWICVGSTPSATEPTAEIDLAHPSAQDRTAAADCIIKAAATSGW